MLIDSETWRGRLIRFAPFILWVAVIFFLSSNLGSSSHTSMIIRPLLNFLFPHAPEEMIQLYHAYIRKTAHFAEYAVLAFWALWAFNRPTVGRARTMIYGLLAVVTVAAIDEYNQSFNLSRTGSWLDVLLDISGGVTMLAIFWIWNRLRPFNTAERTPN